MFQRIKKLFYFPVASYFRFFAGMRLRKWNPRVIVITGSSGKTTLLHLIESQFGAEAKYSHEANSSFGIPFDILGLRRKSLFITEWPMLFFLAPFKVFSKLPNEKIYIVEADCDRPYEGRFLSRFLKSEVTLWTNVSRTHSINFEKEVKKRKFETVDEAIAYEFGFYAENTKKLVIVGDSSELIEKQLSRARCEIKKSLGEENLEQYSVNSNGTTFVLGSRKYNFKFLLPRKTASLVSMCLMLADYLKIDVDDKFSGFSMPPGRSSVFAGIKNTTLIDSTYNANFDSMAEIIEMFAKIDAEVKWIVLGDMIEQGSQEEEEHNKLARLILSHNFQKIVLMGPRLTKYTKPLLLKEKKDVVSFLGPKEVLDYLLKNIKGGEVILFKGARFLEGVIEHLLKNKRDVSKLARREKVWQIRREKWGL